MRVVHERESAKNIGIRRRLIPYECLRRYLRRLHSDLARAIDNLAPQERRCLTLSLVFCFFIPVALAFVFVLLNEVRPECCCSRHGHHLQSSGG